MRQLFRSEWQRSKHELCRLRESVVIASLQELHPVVENFIDQAVRFVDPAGPDIAAKMLQRLRLPNPDKGIAQHSFHQIEDTQSRFAVRVHPEPKVLQALVLEDRAAPAWKTAAHDTSLNPSSYRSADKSLALVRPRRARVKAASRRAAFWGDRRR